MQTHVRLYTRPRINKRSHEAPREHQNKFGLPPGGNALNFLAEGVACLIWRCLRALAQYLKSELSWVTFSELITVVVLS